ncbi:GIY-YIG nuclease [Bodo saltans virus]|uniref:GIY-YIG nuclease n=1 Tax=Bodo saltans virus TaxID=2024608 RepID=A0A2H4UWA1_9VIRU|nr:GIY-YIG nuclease [Bodo saltans virus]ATZ81228.1 GIY-YIG nuclease [Bodo saltans virus]
METTEVISIGYVYIIKSNKTEKVYIGSTKHNILKRFRTHEHNYSTGKNGCASREIIKYGDAFCEMLERVEYNDIKTLRNREKEIIQSGKYKCCNIIWLTNEDDDFIIEFKEKKEQELQQKKEIANLIMSYFDENKIYTKTELKDVFLKIKIFDELIEENYKKILGKINIYLKMLNKKIMNKRKKKRYGKSVKSISSYIFTPLHI